MADVQQERRSFKTLVPFISGQFPDFVRSLATDVGAPDGDKALAIAFVEAYYEWLEQMTNSRGRLHEFEKLQSTNYLVQEFFDHLRNTYLKPIPLSFPVDSSLLVKHVREFYKTRGTNKSIIFLFKVLFGEDITITYDESRRLPGDGPLLQDSPDRLGIDFILGLSTLEASAEAAERILFLDYQSIHRLGQSLLGEDFILGESRLTPLAFLLAAEAQEIDLDTFHGTVIEVVPENYTYYIHTAQDEEDYAATLKEMVHPAGTLAVHADP